MSNKLKVFQVLFVLICITILGAWIVGEVRLAYTKEHTVPPGYVIETDGVKFRCRELAHGFKGTSFRYYDAAVQEAQVWYQMDDTQRPWRPVTNN